MSWNLFDYQKTGKIDIYILIHKEFVFIPIYARGVQAKNLISENKASILINMMCDNLACICFVAVSSISLISSSEGQLAQILGRYVPEQNQKSRPVTQANFFIEKTQKPIKTEINLLIFLDLSHNRCKKIQILLSSRAKCPNFSYFYI